MKIVSSYLGSQYAENFTIQENGLKLQHEDYLKIRNRLLALSERAPAVSSIKLYLNADQEIIKGELIIIGAGRKFTSSVKGENPWQVYKLLERHVDRQLFLWKKRRHFMTDFNLKQVDKYYYRTGGLAV